MTDTKSDTLRPPANDLKVSFLCLECRARLWFESTKWDLLVTLDLECPKCQALYFIPIHKVRKGKNDADT